MGVAASAAGFSPLRKPEVMRHEKLLAKSPSNPSHIRPEETLLWHTRSVCEASETLASITKDQILASLSLESINLENWETLLWLCAWIHDWGKANNHFQEMIRAPRKQQGLRHEYASIALFMDFEKWIEPVWGPLSSWEKAGVIFSVAGHHLKCPDPLQDVRTGTKITLYRSHQDFLQVLEEGRIRFDLGPVPALPDKEHSLLRKGIAGKALGYIQGFEKNDFSADEKKAIAALKTTFLSADLTGSCLARHENTAFRKPGNWIANRLGVGLDPDSLLKVARQKIGTRKPRTFQEEVGRREGGTTILEAGCGSGKTVAAYLWAAAQGPGHRLFFCYPTTGTASEGFSGYLHDPEFEALLIHSRAAVDYAILPNMPSLGHEESELHSMRMEALETWPVPAVVCTAHTVLGLLENTRRGLYAWPSILKGMFVFDEVHAYSDRVFSYLLQFLDIFRGAPVLLMTATLPGSRRTALEEVCRKKGPVHFLKGPREREQAARYTLEDLGPDLVKCKEQVAESLNRGEKVLWICNTVGEVMSLFEWAERENLPVEPYHSRYRYRDRLLRHRAVVDGFRTPEKPLLALTTQVAEISLDLSADLLVSEYAPIPAMIQRMGRLNRHEETPCSTRPAIFIKPETEKPYEEEELRVSREWICHLADGKPKSQAELADAFVRFTPEKEENSAPPLCGWLDGLWRTETGKTAIEENGHTVEMLLERDSGNGNPAEFAIPMPIPTRKDDWLSWPRQGRFPIIPDGKITYSERRGATWKKA